MLLKDNEEKRNIAWRTVMTVTSVLIILIAIFFAVKLLLLILWQETGRIQMME